MKFSAIFATISTGVVTQEATGFPRCPHDFVPEELHRMLATTNSTTAQKFARDKGVEITTYVHVIAATKSGVGNITESAIRAQIGVINEAFEPAGFRFKLGGWQKSGWDLHWASVTPAANAAAGHKLDEKHARKPCAQWDDYSKERCYKTYFRHMHSRYADLNLYILPGLTVAGFATFPSLDPNHNQKVLDGIAINSRTMPDGPDGDLYRGYVAVHNIGHWLGLSHPYEGYDCHGRGDGILDTPAQAGPTEGCPADGTVDSCPDRPGLDDIHNFMDASSEDCFADGRGRFSVGQVNAMHNNFRLMRETQD